MQVLSLNVSSATSVVASNGYLHYMDNVPQYPKLNAFRITPTANSLYILFASKDASVLKTAHGSLIKGNIIQDVAYIRSFDGDALRNGDFSTRLHRLATDMGVKVNVNLYYQRNEIEIHGPIHVVDVARVRILALLDEMCGLEVVALDKVPMYFHWCVSGRKGAGIQAVMEETGASIYLEPSLGQLPSSNVVYITGDSEAVAKAEGQLLKIFSQKSNTVCQKKFGIDAYKLDWLLFNKIEEVKKIMYDNGSFIQFPELGSKNPSITVYADSQVYVERSIRFLIQLTSEIFEANFNFSKNLVGGHNQLISLISELTQVSGVNASYMDNHLKLWGTYSQLTVAVETLAHYHVLTIHGCLSSFSVKIPTEFREFVSGKKNGKLNKIISSCGVHIDFLDVNEYITSIELRGNNLQDACRGFAKLKDELPAEKSFYIPAKYHRKLIGVGGKNIQRVMKKYGVYIKLSDPKEMEAIGGYHENEDNVIARTPMKNRDSLLQIEEVLFRLVRLQDNQIFVSWPMVVPYKQHGKVMRAYRSRIGNNDIHARKCQVFWPQSSSLDKVVIYGPSTSVSYVVSFTSQLITRENQIVAKVKDEAMARALQDRDFVHQINCDIIQSKRIRYELLPVTIIKLEDWKKGDVELVFDYYLDSEYVALFRIVYTGSDENENIPEITEMIGKRVEEQGFPFELAIEEISIVLANTLLDSDHFCNGSLFNFSSDSSDCLFLSNSSGVSSPPSEDWAPPEKTLWGEGPFIFL